MSARISCGPQPGQDASSFCPCCGFRYADAYCTPFLCMNSPERCRFCEAVCAREACCDEERQTRAREAFEDSAAAQRRKAEGRHASGGESEPS